MNLATLRRCYKKYYESCAIYVATFQKLRSRSGLLQADSQRGSYPHSVLFIIRNAHVLECTYQMLEEYTNKSALNEHDYLLLRTVVTLHSNVVISSAEIRREIWERAVNSELYLRTTHLSHSPLNAHIAMCLLNCIANDAELRYLSSLR